VGASLDRERSSDSLGEASGVSVAESTGLERISNEESPHAKRSGLPTRVEFEEVGERGIDREVGSEGDGAAECCVFDAGCGGHGECDGASGVGLAVGMEGMSEVIAGLLCAANARTTAS